MPLTPHTHPTRKPSPSDLVLLRFSLPAKMATATPSEVLIRTCAESVIRIPRTLLKSESADHFLFEARVPRDVAATVRSIYAELFRLTREAASNPPASRR
jgi:hypothetical protein